MIRSNSGSRKLRKPIFGVLCAALVGGAFYFAVPQANAVGIALTDVAAGVSAPATVPSGTIAGPSFPVTGTITNSGLVAQPAGSTLTISVTHATLSGVAAGCTLSADATSATCTAGALNSNASQSFGATANPASLATSVVTSATSKAAFVESSVPPPNPNDDTASATTAISYDVGLTMTSNPANVASGQDTLVTPVLTNNGVPQSHIALSVASGNVVDTAKPIPAGCSLTAGNAGLSCSNIALAHGASQSFPVYVKTPATGSSVTSNATATNDLGATKTASATTNLYGLGLSLSSNPSTVLSGNDTLLSAIVSNNGAPQTNVVVKVNTGGIIDSSFALPSGCTAASGVATCTVSSLATGASKQFDIAVTTNPTATSMASSATATGANGSSASASATTTEDANAAAFVPQTKSLSNTTPADSNTFSVPQGSTVGLILKLQDKDVTGLTCGTGPCNPTAVEALFPNTGTYSANDVNHPLMWKVTYNFKQSCNGLGTPSGCNPLYWMGSGQNTPQQLLQCTTFNKNRETLPAHMLNANTPCINFVTHTTGGIVTYDVAVLKDISLPILL